MITPEKHAEQVRRVLTSKHNRGFHLPQGFPHILKEFSREYIRNQPEGTAVYQFAANYFSRLSRVNRPFAVISEATPDGSGNWSTTITRGLLVQDRNTNQYSINWGEQIKVTSGFASKGRQFQVRDMLYTNGSIFILDASTGTVFECLNNKLVPRHILADSDGTQSTPFLAQWMTMKGGELWVGGLGHHEVDENGEEINTSYMWVKSIGAGGRVTHHDWKQQYQALNLQFNSEEDDPSYLIHGACRWSPSHDKWFFIPRKGYSSHPAQEYFVCNGLFIASEDFSVLDGTYLADPNTVFEMTAFEFVPGRVDEEGRENEIMVVKNVGDKSYIALHEIISGSEMKLVMEDLEVPGTKQLEGLIFF
eukprot:gnl/Hemi2/23971_TR8041_c0_g1_i1.p1 gnl/Hemi2/23971_TR8041_c0_g1~~gnl/Hemi2/23971_TR8041_c0_g1_i1.p1  ORF type:complete len:363 (-),score=122.93 gnl/Hemi2/23971_TR8041_c0_g1_i1:107-1195(-)